MGEPLECPECGCPPRVHDVTCSRLQRPPLEYALQYLERESTSTAMGYAFSALPEVIEYALAMEAERDRLKEERDRARFLMQASDEQRDRSSQYAEYWKAEADKLREESNEAHALARRMEKLADDQHLGALRAMVRTDEALRLCWRRMQTARRARRVEREKHREAERRLEAERDRLKEDVDGLDRAVDHANNRIAEVLNDRDAARAQLASLEERLTSEGAVQAAIAAYLAFRREGEARIWEGVPAALRAAIAYAQQPAGEEPSE